MGSQPPSRLLTAHSPGHSRPLSLPERHGCHSTSQSTPTTEVTARAQIARARLGLVTKRCLEVPPECMHSQPRNGCYPFISDDLVVYLAYLPSLNEDAFSQECYTLCVWIRTCIDTCTSGPGFSVDTCTSGPGFSVDTCTSGPGFSIDTCTSVDTNLPPTDSPKTGEGESPCRCMRPQPHATSWRCARCSRSKTTLRCCSVARSFTYASHFLP